jgi:hypothetical protein
MAQFDHITDEDLQRLTVKEIDGVRILDGYEMSYCQTALAIYGADLVDDQYSPEAIERFQAFCAEKGITYYGAPKGDFFMSAAVERALYQGNTYLIAEDLS